MQVEWIEVRHPDTGKLLFRLNRTCTVVHIKPPGQKATYINLREECEKVKQPLDKTE